MSLKWSRWTKQEMGILRKHFEFTPWSELLLMLPGRSPQYIRNLGRKLKMKRKVEQVHKRGNPREDRGCGARKAWAVRRMHA